MEKEIIKLKDSIEALNRTSKDMKVSFHYTDNDEEIDAIKTVAEAAENYLEMKKVYKKLVNDRDLAVKICERQTKELNHQAKELNHIGYFLIETLGYTMQEVMVIADTSLEIQDVNRKLKELKESNEEATFEDAREEITKDMYEEYCNKFDDIVLNKDFKKSAIKRKLKELIEEINHYYGDDSTVSKDIFDLVQEINEKIKDPQISTVVKIAKALDLDEHEFAELCGYRKDDKDEEN